MNIRIKALSLFLVIILLFTSLGQAVYAVPRFKSPYYYNQLSPLAKDFYNELSNIRPDDSTVKITYQKTFSNKAQLSDFYASLAKAFFEAATALSYDNVNMFLFEKKFNYKISSVGIHPQYDITIRLNYYLAPYFKDNYKQAAARYQTALNSVPVHGSNRYEKLKSIYEYLANTVTYLSGKNSYTSYAALVDKLAVCEGYSRAFKALCDRENIPCILVSGIANKGQLKESHMWNYVQMEDGKWYAIDSTWGDQVSYIDYDYLLIGRETKINGKPFSQTHIPEGEVGRYKTSSQPQPIPLNLTYPSLSATKYIKTNNPMPPAPLEDECLDIFNPFDIIPKDGRLYFTRDKQKIANLFNPNSMVEYKIYDKGGLSLKADDVLPTGSKIVFYENGMQTFTYNVIIQGDIDKNGKISSADARLALRAASKLTKLDEDAFLAADVSFKNSISSSDARKILRVASCLDDFK